MNRNIVSALALVSMLALLGGCNEEAKPQKPVPQFGVVQLSKLYQESKLGKEGIARVNELENKAMTSLSGLQQDLEKAQAAKNEAEVQRLQKELQGRVFFLQNVIKQDQEHVMHVFLILLDHVLQKEHAALQFLLKTLHLGLVLGGLGLFQILLKSGKRGHGLVFQLVHTSYAFLAELGFLIELGKLHHAELRNGLLRLRLLVAAAEQRKHGHKGKSGNYVSVHSLSPVINVPRSFSEAEMT